MVFLHGLGVVWGGIEDAEYALRDANGNPIFRSGSTTRLIIDLNHTGWQQLMIDIAVAIDQCGLYDGIFIDGWGERRPWRGHVAILKRDTRTGAGQFSYYGQHERQRQAPDLGRRTSTDCLWKRDFRRGGTHTRRY